jgi:glycopeptide antibiotics resistance protein
MQVVVGDSGIDLLPAGVVILVALLIVLWRRQQHRSYLVCVAVFGIYVLFALDKAFFPIRISEAYADGMTPTQFMWSVNLIPFNFDFSFIPHIVMQQILMNVLLTVPFGFGVSFVARVQAKHILWIALAVGAGIETVQLIISLALRYPYRVIDINDAMLNALGVLIGYGLFRVFARLYISATERFGIARGGLAAYVHDAARRA